MVFHVPHDWPHWWIDGKDPSIRYPSPPASGVADIARFVARMVAAMRKRAPAQSGAPAPEGQETDRARGLALPLRPF